MLRPAGVWLLAVAPLALAQQYSISTIAGGAPPTTPVAAASASIGQPRRVAVDSSGKVYFSAGNSVFQINGGTLALVAGNSRAGFAGDGGAAVNAQLNAPQGVAVDAAGNVYIADTLNNRVRIVDVNGIINTFAGNGLVGYINAFGDGGPANQANLHLPAGVTADSAGNVYIADTGDNLIRKVTTDGNIATVAGNGFPSYFGDAGPANQAELHSPEDVAVDSSGNIYIADTGNAYIRKVTTDGNINFIGGDGSIGFAGDGGAAISAGLIEPYSIAVDSSGNIFIAEPEDGRIREIDTKGNINTIAGSGTLGFSGDGSGAVSAKFHEPAGVAVDSSGNLYIADSLNNRVRKIAGGTVSTIAGSGVFSYSGDGGPAIAAELDAPQAVAVDSAGNSYIADTANNVVRKVTASGGISTIGGTGAAGSGGDGGSATAAQFNAPQGIAVDSAGNVYVADTQNARVRKIAVDRTVSTVAGTSVGYGGDGAAATSALLNTPIGLAVDAASNLYIADFGNNVIRKVTAAGTISTVAGNATQGRSGDGGQATAAQLNGPEGVAVDSAGNLYIADTGNNVIRQVSAGGVIATVAGNGLPGYAGDGGLALNATIGSPAAVSVDAAGSLYIADSGAHVRKAYPSGPIITIAGNGSRGYAGDGGMAASAMLNGPMAAALDARGNVYIADTLNNAIRLLRPTGSGVAVAAVANGASNKTGPISPGEVLAIYGSAIGPNQIVQNQLNASRRFGTSLANTSVFINGAPAPLLYVSPNQVGAIVPYAVSGASAQVLVLSQGQVSAPVTVPVAAVSPGLFTANGSGTGQAAAVNQDSSVNGAAHPAKAGTFISLYATGTGQTNPAGQDGLPADVPLPLPIAPVTVTIGGQTALVIYKGGAPNIVAGVTQINVQVPSGLTAGAVPVMVQVGTASTQAGVTIVVQ